MRDKDFANLRRLLPHNRAVRWVLSSPFYRRGWGGAGYPREPMHTHTFRTWESRNSSQVYLNPRLFPKRLHIPRVSIHFHLPTSYLKLPLPELLLDISTPHASGFLAKDRKNILHSIARFLLGRLPLLIFSQSTSCR